MKPTLLARFRALFARTPEPAAPPAPRGPADDTIAKPSKGMKISSDAVAASLGAAGATVPLESAYKLRRPAPGVLPADVKFAMDASTDELYNYAISATFNEGMSFLGYPYLSELTQRAEYRRPAEILAKEMTRKWIKFQASGSDGDKTEKIKAIEAEFKRLGVQRAFRRATELDGYFGRAHIFLEMGSSNSNEVMKTPLFASANVVAKGSLKRLVVVEPMWTYPDAYNSTDPLDSHYFRPESWFVMSRRVHASRLMTFVSRPVPDLLKPAYMFGGLALSQIAKPYVDNWLRTRQSVSDLIHSFSVFVLKTNLGGALSGGNGEIEMNRAQLFNNTRDNRGLMMIDKDSEEFQNVTAPLSSLDKLQAQSQEHMAAVTGIPLVVLLGITPSGLNATSEGEMEAFYAWIEAQQEALYTPPLDRLLELVQLSLFGEVDSEIGYVYEPLMVLDKATLATARKTEADTDIALIDAGVISPEESRTRLAAEEDSPYQGLDVNGLPEPPPDPDAAPGGDPFAAPTDDPTEETAAGATNAPGAGAPPTPAPSAPPVAKPGA